MYVSKKKWLLTVIYCLAALAVMLVNVLRTDARVEELERAAAVDCDRAFSELTAAVSGLDTSLKKTLCAASPAMVGSTCAQAYAQCTAAGQAISGLPYGSIELEHTASYLAKTGDYLYYLTRAAARGEELTEQERQALTELSKSAEQVSGVLSELTARLLTGEISTAELEQAEEQIAGQEDRLVDTGFAASFKAMESEFPEMPSLIYDGPFSEHLDRPQPALLKGLPEIGEEEAAAAAAKFLNADPESLSPRCRREGDIPVFVLTRQYGSEVETVEVSCAGGRVVYYGTTREPQEGDITPEAAVKTAARFLESHGWSSMTPTYHTAEGGECTVNFAFEQDGVICYPDLVKVTVAMDTGNVTGLEAGGYTMCHTERQLPGAKIDPETAGKRLSPMLTVKSSRPALIPTSGKYEVLCREYLCETPDGRHALVYLNAETGAEEKILLLLESDSGTLTI